MSREIRTHKDLLVWQQGMELVVLVYRMTWTFPKYEIYALSNQMQRAAVSIPTNVAEGFGRRGRQELVQFLYIALGSASEVETLLIIAERLNYIDHESFRKTEELLDNIIRMIGGLIRSIKQKE